MKDNVLGPLILAAGGIVERQGIDNHEVLLVYRELYGPQWSFPKGKQEAGEQLENTALREVEEETGYKVAINGFGGISHYFHGQSPKIVVYWKMKVTGAGEFTADKEVVDYSWFNMAEALTLLSHSEERVILERIMGESQIVL